MRSHVHHSMKSELPLNVCGVISNVSGYVKSADCDCRASAIGKCCHVAALLLKLCDFSTDNSNIVIKPSTSEPFTWNKGKKRAKKPKKLHEAEYSSSERKPPSELYEWDPRPKNMRTVPNESVRNFIVSLQSDPKPSMWESLLPLQYENFNLEQSDIQVYRNLVLEFIKNIESCNKQFLESKSVCQIPGTEDQAESDQWHCQRRFRITASTCKYAVKLGESLSIHDSFHPHFSIIQKKLWFPSNFTSYDMQNGKDNEVNSLKEYGQIKNTLV